jgi:plasmid stabilization system protein ParE
MTETAINDLDTIYLKVVELSNYSDIASNLIKRLGLRMKMLEKFAEIGERLSECFSNKNFHHDYRKLLESHYLIIYHVEFEKRIVYIDRIFHERTDYIQRLL